MLGAAPDGVLGAAPDGGQALENTALQQLIQQVLYFLGPKPPLQFCQNNVFLMVMVLYKISLRPQVAAADYSLLKVALCLASPALTLLPPQASPPFFSGDSLVWHGFVLATSR